MSKEKKTDEQEKIDDEITIEDEDVVQLIDDEGNVIDFYWVGTIEHEGNMYVAFEPADEIDNEEEIEVAIFKLDEDKEGNDVFSPIEDEELLNTVFEKFVKLQEEQTDDSCCGGEGGCTHGDCDCGCKKS